MEQRQQLPHVPIRVRVRLSSVRAHGEHEQASRIAEQIGKVALEAVEVTNVGHQQANRAKDGLQQAREAAMQSARALQHMGEHGQEIHTTVMELTDLTTRLNLLALNTAIEAVRAAEHEQSLAGIAQELRTLSVCCTEAVRNIAARLNVMQSEVAEASQHFDASIKQLTMQLDSVAGVSTALDALGIVAEQVSVLAHELGTASSTLSTSSAPQTAPTHQLEGIS